MFDAVISEAHQNRSSIILETTTKLQQENKVGPTDAGVLKSRHRAKVILNTSPYHVNGSRNHVDFELCIGTVQGIHLS